MDPIPTARPHNDGDDCICHPCLFFLNSILTMSNSLVNHHCSQGSGEKQAEIGEEDVAPSEQCQSTAANHGSLFDMLSPELLLIIFQYIGIEDKKSYVRLATCSDRELARFIYKECAYLWREIDLSHCPGVMDAQLRSLLERVNARSVTKSIVLDKTSDSTITGAGLEPLRGSRVLECIDLRQSDSRTRGPTSLDDELVTDLLSTMTPHKLEKIKVRKQHFQSSDFPFDVYCFPWSSFFANLELSKARKLGDQRCSHCDSSLTPNGRITLRSVLGCGPNQCTVCKLYSCRSSKPYSSRCPKIEECQQCLELCCPCRGEVLPCSYCGRKNCPMCDESKLTCHHCGNTSCSKCQQIVQCMECLETSCDNCQDNLFTCIRCRASYCDDCMDWTYCDACLEVICVGCYNYESCDQCEQVHVCQNCQGEDAFDPMLAICQSCGLRKCYDCSFCFHKCSRCNLVCCKDDVLCMDAFEVHACTPPGDLLYFARDARAGDDVANLCTCGKKHLSSPKGQQFMCKWLRK